MLILLVLDSSFELEFELDVWDVLPVFAFVLGRMFILFMGSEFELEFEFGLELGSFSLISGEEL